MTEVAVTYIYANLIILAINGWECLVCADKSYLEGQTQVICIVPGTSLPWVCHIF